MIDFTIVSILSGIIVLICQLLNFINQTYLQISQNQNENLIDIENENWEDFNNEIKDHIIIN